MAKRKQVSVRVRFEVFKRDKFSCRYCGKNPPDVLLELDHIVPVAAGGGNDPSNLLTSCRACNGGKSDRLLVEGEYPTPSAAANAEDAERLRQAKAYAKLVEEMRAHDDERVDSVNKTWAKAFHAANVSENGELIWQLGPGERFPSSGSIRKVLKRLPLGKALEAVDITAAKFSRARTDAESYFFGVCWRMVDALATAPHTPQSAKGQAAERAIAEPGDFEDVAEPESIEQEGEAEWLACTPCLDVNLCPDNMPDWWDYKRGLPPEIWLESPVEYQQQWAFSEAHRHRDADPDAGEPPRPMTDEWEPYWRKYGYPQERDAIDAFWGPDGVGNEPCVNGVPRAR